MVWCVAGFVDCSCDVMIFKMEYVVVSWVEVFGGVLMDRDACAFV